MTALSLIGALGVFSVVFTADPLKGRLWFVSAGLGAFLIASATVLAYVQGPAPAVWV